MSEGVTPTNHNRGDREKEMKEARGSGEAYRYQERQTKHTRWQKYLNQNNWISQRLSSFKRQKQFTNEDVGSWGWCWW